ncbi:MAG: hypothetical protein KAJ19_11750 [Gammaproteobacteria bacterium]|nr:hypothetical protein [Gammaproteobacteria bacterium]
MPRKKRKTRRSRSTSILNVLEAYVYATILTEGTAGTSPVGFITGKTDLGTQVVSDRALGVGTMETVGAGEISLGDIVSEPSLALSTMANNFQSNLAPMAIAAFTTSFTFRIGKRLLRRPIANINRNIMKPALGAGIKL